MFMDGFRLAADLTPTLTLTKQKMLKLGQLRHEGNTRYLRNVKLHINDNTTANMSVVSMTDDSPLSPLLPVHLHLFYSFSYNQMT